MNNRINNLIKTIIIKDFYIRIYDELDSSNSFAKELFIKKEIDHKNIIIANNQLKGRGRFDRKWISCKDNLYFTLFLSNLDYHIIKNLSNLYNIIGDILFAVISDYIDNSNKNRNIDNKITIKAPNDILLNDKKIAGILIESEFINNKLRYILIGIGVNLYNHPNNLQNSPLYQAGNLSQYNINKMDFISKFINKINNILNL